MRTIVLFSFLLVYALYTRAQSCDCPAASTCFDCAGGISSFTLRYNGVTPQPIVATDQGGTVFSQVVDPNATFTFVGTTPNDKFQGTNVDLTVGGTANATIPVNCGSVFVADTFGSFTVVAANSKTGGTLCCSVANTDTTPPQITGCPATVVVKAENACQAVATWTPPTASDNCSASLSSSHDAGSTFALGTTVVTYTASDPAGNTTTCSFDVIVIADSGPVVSGCPDDITQHTYNDSMPVTWTAPQATPVCGDLTSIASHKPGEQFLVGSTEVTYEFGDDTGNKTRCTFNVTVVKDDAGFEVTRAITPNGDGTNDTWEITNIERYKDNTVIIVDRWGNKVYHGSGYDNINTRWNGTGINGSKVPIGTYFYTVEVQANGSLIRKTGFIEVIY